VSTKNNRSTICKTLESIKKLTLHIDTELIIVDGLSKDGTFEVVSSFIRKSKGTFTNAILLRDPGLSLSFSRHIGYKYSKGEYLLFLDGDMVISRMFIDNIDKYLKVADAISPKTVIVPLDKFTYAFNVIVSVGNKLLESRSTFVLPILRLIRRIILDKLGGYPCFSSYFAEDQILVKLILMLPGIKVTYAHDLIIYKIDSPGLSSYIRKHLRYGEGLVKDISKIGKSILRREILLRQFRFLNVFLPLDSLAVVLYSTLMLKTLIRRAKLIDIACLKYMINLAMLLGVIKSYIKDVNIVGSMKASLK